MGNRNSRWMALGLGVGGGGGGGFVGAYDAVPSITAAYGMRRLRSAYTGPILRIRRSGDNEEQDIGYTASGDLDTAALASWLGEANGYITTWYDQSGNANHAAQSTAASQPLYVASGQNGRPVLRFDGTNDYLDTGYIVPGDQSHTLIARYSGASGTGVIVGSRSTAGRNIMLSVNQAEDVIYYANGANQPRAPFIAAGVIGIAGVQPYRNGVADGIGESTTSFTNDRSLWIGNRNGLSSPYSGVIHEVVISNTIYTAQQMADITSIMEAA